MTDKQHKGDLDRISSQNFLTDFARGVEERPRGGLFNNMVRSAVDATPFGQAMHGRTNFEQHDLNDMLDLVEQTNPEDLESSGLALWDARDAITAAAKELDGHIENVHWVGESGDAFRTWSRSLVTSTQKLSDFAGGAGDQITAAAVGLANVRSAMPPRDPRSHATRPEQLPAVKQVEANKEYATAVRVEKDRQEAINQMNRLSSYYAVSTDQLKTLNEEAPEFKAMPDVGVPRPVAEGVFASGGTTSERTGTAAVAGHHAAVGAKARGGAHGTSDTPMPLEDPARRIVDPDAPARTNIDSVGTLPQPSTVPAAGHTQPVTGTPGIGGGPNSPFEGGYGTPISNGTSGRGGGGAGNVRPPASAQGRAGTSGLSNAGLGRSGGRGPESQMGRPAATGQSVAKGASSGAKSSPVGRGVTGGTPRPNSSATPRATGGPATGAGRANGVVGGRATTAGGTSGKGGPRMPRGTVIGAEGPSNSRPTTGRPGQRGVFGAPESIARPDSGVTTSRGGAGASEAVTGRPAARNSVAGAERNGMTRGGTGLVRGPGSHAKGGDGKNSEGPQRPEYLVEGEETHLPTKPRRDVPPGIN
ncbi:WXG100 family type VII secretion target [Streptomyces avermitilis]